MSFSEIPATLQSIYIVNIEFVLKMFILIFVWAICYYTVSKKNDQDEDKTPYLFVAWVRAFKHLLSKFMLYVIPFFALFALYPQFEYGIMLQMVIIAYIVISILFLVIALLNIMFWSPYFLVKICGYDPLKQRSNKIYNDLEKFGANLTYKKNQIFNKFIK